MKVVRWRWRRECYVMILGVAIRDGQRGHLQ